MSAREPWLLHLHHDPATGEYAGLAHADCNCREGAERGNAEREPDLDRPPFPRDWLAAQVEARRQWARMLREVREYAAEHDRLTRQAVAITRAEDRAQVAWEARTLRDAGLRWIDVAEILGYAGPAGAYLAASRV